jgi:nicotinate phosphoribosyltransferase
MEVPALVTDQYQVKMLVGYLKVRRSGDIAVYDVFPRAHKGWGFLVVNGIERVIDYVTQLHFTDSDLEYLKQIGIDEDSLEYLQRFRFSGTIAAIPDGNPIAPNTPIIRVMAPRAEAQFVETGILNTIAYPMFVASKAAQVVYAAGDAKVVEFGLRRAPGTEMGVEAARAAYIVGAVGTSNLEAGKRFGIPVFGTMAHAFIQSFDDEISAFRAFAKVFPDDAAFLIDTYDTVRGAKNAVTVAKEMETRGQKLKSVRLDSGDLVALAKEVRGILNDAGLDYVQIMASSDLNEHKIRKFRYLNAPIDVYGVGTEMVNPIDGPVNVVYKLAYDDKGPRIKLSNGKQTYPGIKEVYRIIDDDDKYKYDILALVGEEIEEIGVPLLHDIVRDGRRIVPRRDVNEIRKRCMDAINRLPEEVRKEQYYDGERKKEQMYELRVSKELNELIEKMKAQYGGM